MIVSANVEISISGMLKQRKCDNSGLYLFELSAKNIECAIKFEFQVNNKNVYVCHKYCVRYTQAKKKLIVVFLKFIFNWKFCTFIY